MELDIVSKRYGKLPSEICNRDIAAYNLDILVAGTALIEELKPVSYTHLTLPTKRIV